ncbi:MAG: peptidoglycan editing factor PgeF [Bilifractor sp.]|jgi:YfiH family protein
MADSLHWNRKSSSVHMKTVYPAGPGLPILTFPQLSECGIVTHGFTTRLGGVSQGYFSSLNLSFSRGDDPGAVRENFRILAKALRVPESRFVFSDQTHTSNVRIVTEEDAGKGIVRESDFRDIDGMITDTPGLMLFTFHADCPPVYLVDPVRRAIGLSHSGWRGTAARIGKVTLERMRENFGTDPADVLAAVGPSICRSCYEVSEDVAEIFRAEFSGQENEIMDRKENGKYQLDLWKTNELILLEAGVRPENISVTDLCTSCNPDLLFSHRRTNGKRGNLAAFLMLNPSEK